MSTQAYFLLILELFLFTLEFSTSRAVILFLSLQSKETHALGLAATLISFVASRLILSSWQLDNFFNLLASSSSRKYLSSNWHRSSLHTKRRSLGSNIITVIFKIILLKENSYHIEKIIQVSILFELYGDKHTYKAMICLDARSLLYWQEVSIWIVRHFFRILSYFLKKYIYIYKQHFFYNDRINLFIKTKARYQNVIKRSISSTIARRKLHRTESFWNTERHSKLARDSKNWKAITYTK